MIFRTSGFVCFFGQSLIAVLTFQCLGYFNALGFSVTSPLKRLQVSSNAKV